MCKVQDDQVIDRVLPDSDVLLSLPFRRLPRPQNVEYQSHPVVENEGDVQMLLWESKSSHSVRINNNIIPDSNDTEEASSDCKYLCCTSIFNRRYPACNAHDLCCHRWPNLFYNIFFHIFP